jgi:NAD(P)-dependent dehydrogenase (short-subunit alcohol dehydrogenase family)
MKKERLRERPGRRSKMRQKPITDNPSYKGAQKLEGKVVVITGGDSGIGRATAILFAKEGAKIAIPYYNEHEDAADTKHIIEQYGGEVLILAGDVGDERFCNKVADTTTEHFGSVDILVNNAAEQHPQRTIKNITKEQIERTFATNIFSHFYMVKAVLPYMKQGGVIINTTSVTAYRGHDMLLDYSATKGAIVSFTRSLSLSLIKKGIRVNAVAPGPVWTPLIPSTFPDEKVESFGKHNPMGRPAQPVEIAPCYLFLACDDSSFMSGQVLHPNGGEIING